MTKDEYIEARDTYLVQSNDVNQDRYIRAFLDWTGWVLDRLDVKYGTCKEVSE